MNSFKLSNLYISIIFIFILSVVINCQSQTKLPAIFESRFPDHIVLNYRQGNFTNSKFDEYIVFFKEKKNWQGLGLNRKDYDELIKRKDRDKIVVFVLKNKEIFKMYELKRKWNYKTYDLKQQKFIDVIGDEDKNIFSGDYSKRDLEFITKGKPQFGIWDGFCYLYDFNGNGLDEILFFELTGRSFLAYIYEFQNNKMQAVLNPGSLYTEISEVQTLNENGGKFIKIFGNAILQKRHWYKYMWDSSKNIYALIEKGVDQ